MSRPTALLLLLLSSLGASPALAQSVPTTPTASADSADAAVRKTLSARKVTLDFSGMSLADAIGFLRESTGLNFVLAPAVDARVTLRVKDVAARKALELALSQSDATYEVWRGTVFIASKAHPVPAPPAAAHVDPKTAKTLAERKVTLNFPDTPLLDVVHFLQDMTGLNVVVGKDVDAAEVRLALRLKDVPLGDALQVICRLTGLKIDGESDALLLNPR